LVPDREADAGAEALLPVVIGAGGDAPGRFVSKLTHYLRRSVFGVWADIVNVIARRPVTGDAPLAVSLTTHGIRIARAHRTIESIGRGGLKPQRLVLWLADSERGHPLPRPLRRLQRRGLQVRYADDAGPHTKYFPYVCSEARHALPLVTADDDMWYPAYWLERLWDAYRREPTHVHCYRARRVRLEATHLAPYRTWPFADDDAPAPTVFATGVSGVIYPPALLDRLRDQGAGFRQCCPKADDIWLHVSGLRHGFAARQLGPEAMEFNTMPATQSIGLQNQNVGLSLNDAQALATYTPADLARLRLAANGVSAPPAS
jgi:hypothetical protein